MSSRNFIFHHYVTKIFIAGVQIFVKHFLCFTFYLPLLAFIACLILTIYKDNKKATRTHCNVTNYLPSLSAVIAEYEPQRFIWRFCFAVDSAPRYIIGYLQLQRLLNRHHVAFSKFYRLIQIINSCIHFLELTFLLVLTYVSSNEKKRVHEGGFLAFMICSLLHMLCTILIDYCWRRTKKDCLTENEIHIRTKRLRWFLCNISSSCISLYFFFRHNRLCEPYIYSVFCFFEYVVILTNIGYHAVVREEWDQQSGQIQFFY